MDFSSMLETAVQHSGNSGDEGMFQNAMGFLEQNHHQISQGGVDEQAAVQSHQAVTQGDGSQQHDANTLGMAAGVDALKAFTSGGGSGGGQFGGVESMLGGLV